MVRACDPTYETDSLKRSRIQVVVRQCVTFCMVLFSASWYLFLHVWLRCLYLLVIPCQELPFVDGDPPPDSVIKTWLQLVHDHTVTSKEHVIAVHCIAYASCMRALPLHCSWCWLV